MSTTTAHDVFRLHQHLIGLRRRHPWLHTATNVGAAADQHAVRVPDQRRRRRAVGRAQRRRRADVAVAAGVRLATTGAIVAGSGAPPEDVVDRARGRAARLADRRPCLTSGQPRQRRGVLARRRRTSRARRRSRASSSAARANSVIDDRSFRSSGQPNISSAERPSIARDQPRRTPAAAGRARRGRGRRGPRRRDAMP